MQCESRTESEYFFPQLVFIAYSYRDFSASALQWFIINSTQETSSTRIGNSWPVLLNAKRHTQWELRETFGIRAVCATFGIHGAGHCCKFHLILCHIASCPCRAVAHASDIFTLNMQNFQHSKFSLWPSPDMRTDGRTESRTDGEPSALAQRVKCKYSKLFLKCAQRLSYVPASALSPSPYVVLSSPWVLFSFRCSANVIGIRSFVSFAHDVFCNNEIWLKFLIKFMLAHTVGTPFLCPSFCHGQLYFSILSHPFLTCSLHCRCVCYQVD